MKTLLATAMILCGLFYAVKPVFAQTWTQTGAPTRSWTSIVSSADGNNLTACGGGPGIFTSTNSGATWTFNSPSTYNGLPVGFQVLTASADGNQLAGAEINLGVIGVSTNRGVGWLYPTNFSSENPYWLSIASSADGKTLVLTMIGSNIVASTNSGATWYLLTILPDDNGYQLFPTAALSGKGNCLAVSLYYSGDVYDNGIYSTTNFGKNWVTNSLYDVGGLIAASADGTKLVTVFGGDSGGDFVTSSNSGVTWVRQTNSSPHSPWISVASSSDGIKLAAVSGGVGDFGSIYTSTDSGVTWVSNNAPNLHWVSVASSADGSKLFAAAYSGGIWTSQTTSSPQLKLTPSGDKLAFSWIMPSTNFMLQENSGLAITDWVTLTNVPALDLTNLNYEVTLPQINSSGFFRLISQ